MNTQRLGLMQTPRLTYHHTLDMHPTTGALHCHEQHELYFFVSGRGEYYVEGNRYQLRPYTLIVMKPNEFHYFRLTGETPYERYSLHFSESLVAPDDRELLLGPSSVRQPGQENIYPADTRPELIAAFNRLDQASNLPADEAELMGRAVLTEILVLILGYHRRPLPQQDAGLITRTIIGEIIVWLNEHLFEPVSLDELAARFFINKYHLCHQFKQATGTSVLSYVLHKRVLFAQNLRKQGASKTQAARQAGFSDYSAYYRASRRFLGQSTTQKSAADSIAAPVDPADDGSGEK